MQSDWYALLLAEEAKPHNQGAGDCYRIGPQYLRDTSDHFLELSFDNANSRGRESLPVGISMARPETHTVQTLDQSAPPFFSN
eukprot:scaffold120835_cov19-Tisochrysis_lutea.AAC.1